MRQLHDLQFQNQFSAYGLDNTDLRRISPRRLARLNTLSRRLRLLQWMWRDQATYDRIVGSDRHVKLTDATCCAAEAVERERIAILFQLRMRHSESLVC